MTAQQLLEKCCCDETPGPCEGCENCLDAYAGAVTSTGTFVESGGVTYSYVVSVNGVLAQNVSDPCVFGGALTGTITVTGNGLYDGQYVIGPFPDNVVYRCIAEDTDPPTPAQTRFSLVLPINPGLGGVFVRVMQFSATISPPFVCPPDGASAVSEATNLDITNQGTPIPSTLSTFVLQVT